MMYQFPSFTVIFVASDTAILLALPVELWNGDFVRARRPEFGRWVGAWDGEIINSLDSCCTQHIWSLAGSALGLLILFMIPFVRNTFNINIAVCCKLHSFFSGTHASVIRIPAVRRTNFILV